ncbi:MAG: hypothetical protein ACFFAH_09155 [Promethearchaeota archaeon]
MSSEDGAKKTNITVESSKKEERTHNKFVGPGLGLIILGLVYFVWYIMPFSIEYLEEKPLAIHNWGYSIIFLTIGLAWYQKSVISRSIATIQASLIPILASGSFNPFIIVALIFIIFAVFGIVFLIERKRDKFLFQERLQRRTWEWLNMHLLILSWILIIHIGFVFLIVRAPTEIDLLRIGPNAGWLKNYTPELHEISTWAFDIAIIVWGIIVLYEQFKMGYNFKNNPWPRWSFYAIFLAIAAGLIGLLIQYLTYGFEINNILELFD